MGLKDFLNSDAGRLARFQSRKRRRVSISIHDIEPQSKKMSESERIRFQTEIANQLGDNLYEAYLKMTRFYAQRALLASSRVQLPILSWMYGRPRIASHLVGNEIWAKMTTESSVRLQVGSLPVASGGSTVFKESIRTEISAFKKRWDWLISPLVVPVGLEVIVRPSPKTPSGVLHDLDNVVRDYLIPEIVPSFGTVSDHRWTIHFDQLKQSDSKLAETWGPMPPAGTRVGVTRYEAWRLPAADGQPGFVSVALVADLDAAADMMEMADRKIDEWSETLTRKSRW